jgi:SOS response regulatory protein OraA/RecX
MIIQSLKVSRRPNLIWLTFDAGHYLAISIDDVYKYSLKKGDLIDDQKLRLLFKISFNFLLMEYALRQIALSPKNEKIIRQKLKLKYLFLHRKYHPPQLNIDEIINEIILKLKDKNLLDETAYVKSLLRRHSHKSAEYLKSLLINQGIDFQKYNHLIDFSEDITKIKKLLPRLGTDQKAILKLIRRGFSLSYIKKAIDDCQNVG